MAFCSTCGKTIADGTTYCPQCGAPQGQPATAGAPVGYAPVAATSTGIQENIAGLLCYLLGWITGLIFFFIDKRPFVRFHAAQSIVVFGSLNLLSFLIRIIFGYGIFGGGSMFWAGFSVFMLLVGIINLLAFILWIVLMIQAYQGKRFEVPIAAPLAKQLAARPS